MSHHDPRVLVDASMAPELLLAADGLRAKRLLGKAEDTLEPRALPVCSHNSHNSALRTYQSTQFLGIQAELDAREMQRCRT